MRALHVYQVSRLASLTQRKLTQCFNVHLHNREKENNGFRMKDLEPCIPSFKIVASLTPAKTLTQCFNVHLHNREKENNGFRMKDLEPCTTI